MKKRNFENYYPNENSIDELNIDIIDVNSKSEKNIDFEKNENTKNKTIEKEKPNKNFEKEVLPHTNIQKNFKNLKTYYRTNCISYIKSKSQKNEDFILLSYELDHSPNNNFINEVK
jgi:hypothetical protein